MAAPYVRSAGSFNGSTGNAVPGIPAGLAANDILICVVQSSAQAISAPANSGGNTAWQNATWTEIGSQADMTDGAAATAGSVRQAVYWMRFTSAMTVGTVTVTDTINHTLAQLIAVAGCLVSGSPVYAHGECGTANANTGGWFSSTSSHSTGYDGSFRIYNNFGTDVLCLTIVSHAIDSNTGDRFSAWSAGAATEVAGTDSASNVGTGGGIGVAYEAIANGGYHAPGCTLSTSSRWECQSLLLKPELPPIVALNTADGYNFGSDLTPTLEFTGTDAEGYDVTYQIQIGSEPTVDVAIWDQSHKNYDRQIGISGDVLYVGEAFLSGNGGILDSCRVFLRKWGAPTGNVTALLYAMSGSVPTGSPLATSDAVNVATILEGRYQWVEFAFSAGNRYSLQASTEYALVVNYSNGTSGNYLTVGTDTGGTYRAGNTGIIGYAGPTWSANAYDAIFSVHLVTQLDKLSASDSGFANTVNGGDSDPFTSGQKISFTVQEVDALTAATWYWRARGKDGAGSNQWGDWSAPRSFILSSSAADGNAVGTSTAAADSGATKGTAAGATGTSATSIDARPVLPTIASTAGTSTAQADVVDAGAPIIEERTVTTAGTSATDVNSGKVLPTAETLACTSGTNVASAKIWAASFNVAGTSGTGVTGGHLHPTNAATTATSATNVAGRAIWAVSETLAGTSTTTIVSGATKGTAAGASCLSTTTYVGAALWLELASSVGSSTASADTLARVRISVDGSSAGASTTDFVSGATAKTEANTTGTSTAQADYENASSPVREVQFNVAGASTAQADILARARIAVDANTAGTSATGINSGARKITAASTAGTSATDAASAAKISRAIAEAGTCTITANSGATKGSVASAAGTSEVTGQSSDAAFGSDADAAGTSTAQAVSGRIASVVASAAGGSTASASGRTIAMSAGVAAGSASVNGAVAVIFLFRYSAAGSSTAQAVAIIAHNANADIHLGPLQSLIIVDVEVTANADILLDALYAPMHVMPPVSVHSLVTGILSVTRARGALRATSASGTLRAIPHHATLEAIK